MTTNDFFFNRKNCNLTYGGDGIWLQASCFVTADTLNLIFDHIPQFSLSKKNAVLDQNLS